MSLVCTICASQVRPSPNLSSRYLFCRASLLWDLPQAVQQRQRRCSCKVRAHRWRTSPTNRWSTQVEIYGSRVTTIHRHASPSSHPTEQQPSHGTHQPRLFLVAPINATTALHTQTTEFIGRVTKQWSYRSPPRHHSQFQLPISPSKHIFLRQVSNHVALPLHRMEISTLTIGATRSTSSAPLIQQQPSRSYQSGGRSDSGCINNHDTG